MRRQTRHEILPFYTQNLDTSGIQKSLLNPSSVRPLKNAHCGILQLDQLVKYGEGFLSKADFRTMSSDRLKNRNFHFRFLRRLIFSLNIHQLRLYNHSPPNLDTKSELEVPISSGT